MGPGYRSNIRGTVVHSTMGFAFFNLVFYAVTSVMITVVFVYLYRLKYREYFLWWTWGWAFESVRAIAEAVHESAPESTLGAAAAYPLMTTSLMLSALWFLVGTRQLLDSPIRWKPLGVLLAAVALWSLITPALMLPWIWTAAPGFGLSGAVMIWMGGSFLTHSVRRPVFGGRMLGVLLLIWGLHLLGYPALRFYLVSLPGWSEVWAVRFSVSALLSMGVAVFMIVYVLEETGLALKNTEERFRRLFSEAGECILVADPDSARILNANRRAQDLSGYSAEELRGLPVATILIDPDTASPDTRGRWVPEGEYSKADILDMQLRHRDGRQIPVSISRTFIERQEGKRVVLIHMRDETESKRSRAALQIQFERLRALHQISMALSKALDANHIYQIVFDQVRLVLPLDHFVIDHYHAEENTLRTVFRAEKTDQTYRALPPGEKRPPSRPLFETVIRDRQPVLENRGVSNDPDSRTLGLEITPSSSAPGSRMFVPMIASDEVLGLLTIQAKTPGAYDSSMLDLFQNLANLTATALGNSNLFFREHEHSERMRFLKDLGNALSASLELVPSLETAQNMVAEFLLADQAVVYLHDPETEKLNRAVPPRSRAVNGKPAGNGTEGDIPEITASCFTSGQPVVQNDCATVPAEAAPKSVGGRPVRACVAVPVTLRGRTIGVLRLDDCRVPGRFERDDVDFLLLVAKQLAAAIENARTFEAIKKARERFFGLVEFSPFGVALLRAARIVYANQTFRRLLNRDVEKFANRTLADLVEPGELRTLESNLRKVLDERSPLQCELSLLRTDGSQRFCEVHLAPVLDLGEPAVQAVFTDRTRRIPLPRVGGVELRGRVLETLLAGLAGDFSAVFSSILSQTAYLRLLLAPGERIARSVEAIEETAVKASEYLKQILALGERDASGLRVVDPDDYIRALTKEYAELRNHSVRFEIDRAGDVKRIQVPDSLFRLALNGLLGTALDLFPRGVPVTVRLRNRNWDAVLARQLRALTRGNYVEVRFCPKEGEIDARDLALLIRPEERQGQAGAPFGVPFSLALFRAMGGVVAVTKTSDSRAALAILLPAYADTEFPVGDIPAAPASPLPLEATPSPVYQSLGEVVVLSDDDPV